jgi:hypothetical protein
MHEREGDAGGDHEARRGKQQPTAIVPAADDPYPERQQRRPEQRRCRDDTDLERREADGGEIYREQDRDESIAEVAQRSGREQELQGTGYDWSLPDR